MNEINDAILNKVHEGLKYTETKRRYEVRETESGKWICYDDQNDRGPIAIEDTREEAVVNFLRLQKKLEYFISLLQVYEIVSEAENSNKGSRLDEVRLDHPLELGSVYQHA